MKSTTIITSNHGLKLLFAVLCLSSSTFSDAFISSDTRLSRRTKSNSNFRHRKGLHALLPSKEKTETKGKTLDVLFQNEVVKEDDSKNFPTFSNEDEPSIFGLPQSTAKPLALLLLSQFLLFIGVGAVIPTIPLYGKEIGLSSAANGLVISAPALALLLLAKPAGTFADKARKPAMIWGMAIIAISDFGTAMSQSIIPLVIARLGLGAGRCISESGERGMLADLASTIPSLRGRALSIQQVVVALGIAIGAPAGGYVVEQYGPRASFLCVTAAASLALFLYLFLPETTSMAVVEEKTNGADDSSSISSKNRAQDDEDSSGLAWGELIQDPRWRGLSLFEVGARFGYAAKLASIPIIAASILPGGAVGAGALLSAAGLSGLLGGPMGGFLSDRIGSKQTILLTGVTSAIGLISIPFAIQLNTPDNIPDGAAFIAAVLLWSTSVAAQSPATSSFAQEISPPGSTATAMALPRASGDAVYLVAPFLLGYISDLSALPNGTECAFAGICGLIGVSALALV
jgi:MFS family permease